MLCCVQPEDEGPEDSAHGANGSAEVTDTSYNAQASPHAEQPGAAELAAHIRIAAACAPSADACEGCRTSHAAWSWRTNTAARTATQGRSHCAQTCLRAAATARSAGGGLAHANDASAKHADRSADSAAHAETIAALQEHGRQQTAHLARLERELAQCRDTAAAREAQSDTHAAHMRSASASEEERAEAREEMDLHWERAEQHSVQLNVLEGRLEELQGVARLGRGLQEWRDAQEARRPRCGGGRGSSRAPSCRCAKLQLHCPT